MLRADIVGILKQAVRAHETGAGGQAEQVYREVLAAHAGAADAWNMLAVALCQQNRLDPAAEAAERATALRPKVAPYWLTRGNIAAARRLEREARASFRRAVEIKPDFTEAHYWLGRSYQREARPTDAIAAYCAALRCGPGGRGNSLSSRPCPLIGGALARSAASISAGIHTGPGRLARSPGVARSL